MRECTAVQCRYGGGAAMPRPSMPGATNGSISAPDEVGVVAIEVLAHVHVTKVAVQHACGVELWPAREVAWTNA